VTGIRHTADLMIGPYLARRGQENGTCDKNLGTEPYADVADGRITQRQKFICPATGIPMDVIASGIEGLPVGG